MEELEQYIKSQLGNDIEFYYKTVLNNKKQYENIVFIYKNDIDWFYEIQYYLIDKIDKYCIKYFKTHVSIIDLDIGGIHSLWNNSTNYIDNNVINRLFKFLKKHNIFINYIINGNDTIGVLCKLPLKINHKIHYKSIIRLQNFLKKYNLSISWYY